MLHYLKKILKKSNQLHEILIFLSYPAAILFRKHAVKKYLDTDFFKSSSRMQKQ